MDERTLRETAKQIKMIVCDLDGTLLNEHSALTPATIQAVQAAREHGIYVTFASGRVYTMLSSFICPLDIRGPVITGNGTQIIDSRDSSIIAEQLLEYELAVDILGFCERNRLDCTAFSNELCAIFDYSERVKLFEAYNVKAAANGYPLVEVTRFNSDFSNIKNKKIAKLLVQSRNQSEKLLITDYAKKTGVEVCWSSPVLVEMYNPLANKGTGITAAAAALSLTPQQVCAFGDFDNDIPMFRTAGLVVAMGNAPAHIKDMAHYITDTNARDGVAKAIYELFLD